MAQTQAERPERLPRSHRREFESRCAHQIQLEVEVLARLNVNRRGRFAQCSRDLGVAKGLIATIAESDQKIVARWNSSQTVRTIAIGLIDTIGPSLRRVFRNQEYKCSNLRRSCILHGSLDRRHSPCQRQIAVNRLPGVRWRRSAASARRPDP